MRIFKGKKTYAVFSSGEVKNNEEAIKAASKYFKKNSSKFETIPGYVVGDDLYLEAPDRGIVETVTVVRTKK